VGSAGTEELDNKQEGQEKKEESQLQAKATEDNTKEEQLSKSPEKEQQKQETINPLEDQISDLLSNINSKLDQLEGKLAAVYSIGPEAASGTIHKWIGKSVWGLTRLPLGVLGVALRRGTGGAAGSKATCPAPARRWGPGVIPPGAGRRDRLTVRKIPSRPVPLR